MRHSDVPEIIRTSTSKCKCSESTEGPLVTHEVKQMNADRCNELNADQGQWISQHRVGRGVLVILYQVKPFSGLKFRTWALPRVTLRKNLAISEAVSLGGQTHAPSIQYKCATEFMSLNVTVHSNFTNSFAFSKTPLFSVVMQCWLSGYLKL